MSENEKKFTVLSNDLELIYETSSGEKIYRNNDTILVLLPENRNSVTTSYVNGGYQEKLSSIFNHEPATRSHYAKDLEGGSVEAYTEIHAGRLGVNPEKVAGMKTIAKMKNAAITTRCYRDIEVTAIVTADVDSNAGRAGDPGLWHSEDGESIYVGGTINTMLIINSHLPAHAMVRAIMTATEAKTVALQQLMISSRYSTGIATGSGTDQICVISNMDSPNIIKWAGKHSKLGELIGKCVIGATTEALAKQNNLTPASQRDMLVRLERFGIDEKKYWEVASSLNGENKKDIFIKKLRKFSKKPIVVAMISSILHIVDEIEWGLIPELSGKKAALNIMKTIPEIVKIKNNQDLDIIISEREDIIENWIRITSWCIKNECTERDHD